MKQSSEPKPRAHVPARQARLGAWLLAATAILPIFLWNPLVFAVPTAGGIWFLAASWALLSSGMGLSLLRATGLSFRKGLLRFPAFWINVAIASLALAVVLLFGLAVCRPNPFDVDTCTIWR